MHVRTCLILFQMYLIVCIMHFIRENMTYLHDAFKNWE